MSSVTSLLIQSHRSSEHSIKHRASSSKSNSQCAKSLNLDITLSSSTQEHSNSLILNSKKDLDFLTKKMQPSLDKLEALEKSYAKLEGKYDMESLLAAKDLNDELIETCNQILRFYDMTLGYVSELKVDSALKVFPLVPSKDLYPCLKALINIIRVFPHSFFYKIGINSITLCQEIILLKQEHKQIYQQKLLRGLLSVKDSRNEQDVNRFVLSMIINLMHQKIPQMNAEWKSNFWPSSKKDSSELLTLLMEDQYQALDSLIKYYAQSKKFTNKSSKDKARKMKEYLACIDVTALDAEC